MMRMVWQLQSENLYLDQVKNDDRTLVIHRSRCFFSGGDAIWSLPGPAASVRFLRSTDINNHHGKNSNAYVADFIKANPAVRENAADFIIEVSGWEPPAEDAGVLPAAQRMAIEKMKLPQSVKNVITGKLNNKRIFNKLVKGCGSLRRVYQHLSCRHADQYSGICPGICG